MAIQVLSFTLLTAMAPCCLGATPVENYNAFLKRIASACKPLIISRYDMGQAILHAGMSVDPDAYTTFLSYTSRLYRGTMSDSDYRRSVTAFLGPGSRDKQSFDCIVAHLPGRKDL